MIIRILRTVQQHCCEIIRFNILIILCAISKDSALAILGLVYLHETRAIAGRSLGQGPNLRWKEAISRGGEQTQMDHGKNIKNINSNNSRSSSSCSKSSSRCSSNSSSGKKKSSRIENLHDNDSYSTIIIIVIIIIVIMIMVTGIEIVEISMDRPRKHICESLPRRFT